MTEEYARSLLEDGERYRRLAVLVTAGAWGVNLTDDKDEEVWVDDKAHMDRLLDGEWAKEAASWTHAMKIAEEKK